LTSLKAAVCDKFPRDDEYNQSWSLHLKAVDALLEGLVDYAGLFPPAGESMRQALGGYASYLSGRDRSALGRLIVPLSRLKEFEAVASGFLPRQSDSAPWKLSVIVTGDIAVAAHEITGFNRRHSPSATSGFAIIDAAELKAANQADIERQRSGLPTSLTSYFEIPLDRDLAGLFTSLSRTGARAKIRTGGVTADAFPSAYAIIDFLVAAQREGVPFKATAGLHHPVRGTYRLTYEPGSPTGLMYGFLNVFLAALLVGAGGARDDARALLEESDSSAFSFSDDAIAWRGHRFDVEQIRASRANFAMSFGSCSFREPVDELERLTRSVGAGTR
jgi:hypothetical protein